MTRRSGAGVVFLLAAIGVVALALRARSARIPPTSLEGAAGAETGSSDAGRGLPLLAGKPFYQGLLRGTAVRHVEADRSGAIRAEIDLAALVRLRLDDRGLAALCDGLLAHGEIRTDGSEIWDLTGDAPLLALIDRDPDDLAASSAWRSVPGDPSAVVAVRIVPSHLAEADFGGAAFADWRARADVAEKVLGRPLRAEMAEDLGGLAVFALYEPAPGREPAALLALELRRSDRLRSLFDTVFALAALTERATIHRYRDVPVGFLRSPATGSGWAVAIDGDALLLSRSSHVLETAIDTRRRAASLTPLLARARAQRASWVAVSESPFVAHGWARVARAPDPPHGIAPLESRLSARGASAWRLTGNGPAPAVTADPVVPFLRSVRGGAQRGAD